MRLTTKLIKTIHKLTEEQATLIKEIKKETYARGYKKGYVTGLEDKTILEQEET